MTVKDHSTGLIWLAALPYKRADFVAFELEKYFGFVGYPHIFHTGTLSTPFTIMFDGNYYLVSVVLD